MVVVVVGLKKMAPGRSFPQQFCSVRNGDLKVVCLNRQSTSFCCKLFPCLNQEWGGSKGYKNIKQIVSPLVFF